MGGGGEGGEGDDGGRRGVGGVGSAGGAGGEAGGGREGGDAGGGGGGDGGGGGVGSGDGGGRGGAVVPMVAGNSTQANSRPELSATRSATVTVQPVATATAGPSGMRKTPSTAEPASMGHGWRMASQRSNESSGSGESGPSQKDACMVPRSKGLAKFAEK